MSIKSHRISKDFFVKVFASCLGWVAVIVILLFIQFGNGDKAPEQPTIEQQRIETLEEKVKELDSKLEEALKREAELKQKLAEKGGNPNGSKKEAQKDAQEGQRKTPWGTNF